MPKSKTRSSKKKVTPAKQPYGNYLGTGRGRLTRAQARAADCKNAKETAGKAIASESANTVPARPPHTTFANIPIDLHWCIADHLDHFDDIASLCLVNRKFYFTFLTIFWKRLQESVFADCLGERFGALEWAAHMGLPKTLRYLLDRADKDAFKMPKLGLAGQVCARTLLTRAVESGNDECVKLVISRSKEFNVPDEYFTLGGVLHMTKSHKIFALLAEETISRLAGRGFR